MTVGQHSGNYMYHSKKPTLCTCTTCSSQWQRYFSLYSIENINQSAFVMKGAVFFVRCSLNPYMLLTWLPRVSAVSWLRRSVAGLSPRRCLFDPRWDPCEICGRQGGAVTFLSLSTSVSTVRMVPPILHNHHLRTVLSKGQAGGSLGGFEESSALPCVGEHWIGNSRVRALVQNIASPYTLLFAYHVATQSPVNPLNGELNPICYLLALLGAHHFLHVSRIRVKSLTLRLLMAYIYIYIYIWSTHSWCF